MIFTQGPKTLILIGVTVIALGLLWQVLGPYLNLGRLPGDISIEKENFKFYFPITTSILVSLVLSALFWLWEKLNS